MEADEEEEEGRKGEATRGASAEEGKVKWHGRVKRDRKGEVRRGQGEEIGKGEEERGRGRGKREEDKGAN